MPPDHPVAALRAFVAEHYPALRRAFPVFRHLETVFYACALNVIAGNDRDDAMTRAPVGEYVDGIYHVGGINMQPAPERQASDAAEARAKAREDPCRRAFDAAGIVCAFAPKLCITDCYEDAERHFLQCLSGTSGHEAKHMLHKRNIFRSMINCLCLPASQTALVARGLSPR
jgi:hypothetical protein